MNEQKKIERSIITKYRKLIWSKFVHAINDYQLIEPNDSIAVCISGGKDSFLLAKLFQELKLHNKFEFDVKFLVMDPGYGQDHLKQIINLAQILNIDINISKSDIFEVVKETKGKSPCYLCARMRRGNLYAKAQELGCNKIALGHHFNDVIETTMLNMLYNGMFGSMLPKINSDNFSGMQLIRPLYYVKEESIISWAKYNNLKFIDCACDVTKKDIGKRKEIKALIAKLKADNPNADINIFNSIHNVNLNTIISYYNKQ